MKGILGPDGYPVQFTNFYGDTHQRRMDVPGLPGGQGIFFRTHTPNVGVKLSLENGKLVEDPARNRVFDRIRLLPIPERLHITRPQAVLEDVMGYEMIILDNMHAFGEAFGGVTAPEGFATPWLEELRPDCPEELLRDFSAYLYSGGRRRRLEAYFQCACMLSRLHAAGLVYCDVSANNLFLTSDPEGPCSVWLIDADNLDWQSETAGRPGAGTARVLAPEIIRGEMGNTFYSDSYSFAVLLFTHLTGTHPYAGQTYEEQDFADEALLDSGELPWIWDREDGSNGADSRFGRVDGEHALLSARLLDAFDAAFCRTGRENPVTRPSMAEWAWLLGAELDAAVRCPHCGMDYDGTEYGACPWCDHRTDTVHLCAFLSPEGGAPFWQCVRELSAGQEARVSARLLQGPRTEEPDETAFLLRRTESGLELEELNSLWSFSLICPERQLYGRTGGLPERFRLRCERRKGDTVWMEVRLCEAD